MGRKPRLLKGGLSYNSIVLHLGCRLLRVEPYKILAHPRETVKLT